MDGDSAKPAKDGNLVKNEDLAQDESLIENEEPVGNGWYHDEERLLPYEGNRGTHPAGCP